MLGLVAGGVRHGYAVWRRIDALLGTRGVVQRSHVYAALATLERGRLVAARAPRPSGGRRCRTFDVTAEGRASLYAWLGRAPGDDATVVRRTLLVKLAVRTLLGERPSRREVVAERAARASPRDDTDRDPLTHLLRDRERRHAAVELWLLDRLDAPGTPAAPRLPARRSRSGSGSR